MEWVPGTADQPSVPTDYLWKLMFLHQEPSDLILYSHGQRLGSFHLQPNRETLPANQGGVPIRLLKALGGFTVDTPWLARRNFVVHGLLELNGRTEVNRLELSVTIHEPKQPTAEWTIRLDGQPLANRWHYAVSQGAQTVRENTGTAAELLDLPELRSAGIDTAGFAKLEQQQLAHAVVSARRGKLQMNGDEADAYVLSVKESSGLETTVQMNQLGQILAVKTPLGFELLDGSLTP